MGGFGALDISRLHPGMFCAVGGHSAAIFATAGNTTQGSFDDAEDFAKHDLAKWAAQTKNPLAGTPVWMDVGADDPFHDTDVQVADDLKAHGASISFHVFPGGHNWDYWNAHTSDYVRFYAAALREC
jgi:enterochelin esterase-like enzyme